MPGHANPSSPRGADVKTAEAPRVMAVSGKSPAPDPATPAGFPAPDPSGPAGSPMHDPSGPAASAGQPRASAGKRIVITGASSGLGRAMALELAARFPGCTMLLLARRADRLAELAAELPGIRAITQTVDITDHEALSLHAGRFVAAHGAPDIVIANAGISVGTLTEEREDRDVFARVMAVNVQGVYDSFAPFLASMKAAGTGTLVGIASVAGVRGLPGSGAYSASKAAVAVYLESLRLEMRPHGVSVVTIAPGFIDTDMTRINPYHMPFLMPADRFARAAVDAIVARRRRVVIPWQMGWVARLLRILPCWLYDLAFTRAGRKPRQAEQAELARRRDAGPHDSAAQRGAAQHDAGQRHAGRHDTEQRPAGLHDAVGQGRTPEQRP
mgnify:FL=1